VPFVSPGKHTQAELDRARTQLSAKGNPQPTEDLIFATTEAQRRLERAAASRSRRARRNLARQPVKTKVTVRLVPETVVNYNERVIPYAGEEW